MCVCVYVCIVLNVQVSILVGELSSQFSDLKHQIDTLSVCMYIIFMKNQSANPHTNFI